MRRIDSQSKKFIAFLVVLFLLFSSGLTLNSIQDIRDPQSRAASATVTFIIFNDLDKDGRFDPGESFGSGVNPNFSAAKSRIIQRTFSGDLDITSSFDFGGTAQRTVTTGIDFDWDVRPTSSYVHTKHSMKFYNPGGCSASASSLYICSYDSDGSTKKVNISSTSSIIVYLGIYKDPIDPTVSITSPSHGSTVSGKKTISASASDNIGIDYVRFYVDGSVKKTDTSSPYSYSWDTTNYSNGSHTLKARAEDIANNDDSHSISVNVSNSIPDTTAPSVPGNMRFTSKGSTWIALDWNVSSDNGGSGLAGYKLYRGSTKIKNTTTSSYTNTGLSSSTSYSYYVRAYDNAGNTSGKSNTINVTTNRSSSGNPSPPPPPPPDSGSGSSSNPGSGSSGSGSSSTGSITQTSGISGVIASIKVDVGSIKFLVGQLDAKLSVQDSAIKADIKLTGDKSSYNLAVNGSVPQGIQKTLSISGRNFVNKTINFVANSENPTVGLGNLKFGDINNDNTVSNKDLGLFQGSLRNIDTSGDINIDGTVNSLDYSALLTGLMNEGKINSISEDGKLFLALNSSSAVAGEEFTVDLMADVGEKQADGVDIVLSYDPAMISLVQVSETTAFADYTKSQELDGLLRITALADKDDPVVGINAIASLIFVALRDGESRIEFSLGEDDTTESNIASRLSGQDSLATVDNLLLNVTPDGISAITETVNAKGSSLARTVFLGILILGSGLVIFLLGVYIKRNYLDANKQEVFVPDEVPMDKPPE